MYKNVKVLDVHGHVTTPPDFFAHAASIMAANGPDRKLSIPDELMEAAQQRHLKQLDDRQVDVQLIGPRPYANFMWTRARLQMAWCRATNDVIAQACRLHPDRLLGMAQLPQNAELDMSHCVPEFERCIKELGFVGAYINPDPDGMRGAPGLNDPYWYPIYEKAQELDVPLMVHPAGSRDPRVEALNANYQINNVLEEYLATQLLTRTDVFDKFPNLKVVVCHCGGSLDRWIKTDPHMGQRDTSKNLFFDTCAHDVSFLRAAFEQRGVSQMLFGTEVPGSGGAPRPESGRPADDLLPVIDKLEILSEADKMAVFHDNPKRVFPRMGKV
jgi:predicted TIM-barrel fold metal-dependent hydrolase